MNLVAKFFLYFFPLNFFILSILTQTSYHFLRYQKDKNEYIARGNLLELSPAELKKFHIYLDPTGKYFFDNKFIDLLMKNDKEFNAFLQNIRFIKQDMFIFTGSKPISVAMLNSERLLKSQIQVGVNNDNTPKLCYKPDIFKMLFELENVRVFDLLGLASRFACDCNNYTIDSFDITKLDENQKIDYYNTYRAFIRESLNILKPIKSSAELSFGNLFHYVIISNLTMNFPDIEVRSKGVNDWKILFAILTYFLLALQATILGTSWERIIR